VRESRETPTGRSTAARRAAAWGEGAVAFLVYGAAALFYLRPVWRVGTHRLVDLGDPMFNVYVLSWVGRQIRLGLPDLWGASFYFPMPDALALSDHLLGPAAAALALAPWTGGTVGAYNALTVLSFALSGTTTWAVLRATGLGRVPAFLGGAVYAFAPYRWQQLAHLQVLLAQWVPPLLWSFDRLLARPGALRALAFLAFYALHVTGGNYLAFLVHVPLAALLLHRLLGGGGARLLAARPLRTLVPTGLACAALLAAIFAPYVEVSHRLGLGRAAENFRLYGANLVAHLVPARESHYHDLAAATLPRLAPGLGAAWEVEKALFPGFVPALLALAGAVVLVRRNRRPAGARPGTARRLALAALAVLGIAAFVAADLFTLGWWSWAPGDPRSVDAVYTVLGAAVLGAGLAWALLRRHWTGRPPLALPAESRWERGIVWAGLAAWLVSFPAVFEPLAEVVPGFANMRVPARSHVFTLFALAWLAARGAAALLGRLRRPAVRRLAGAALAAALLAEAAPSGIEWHPVPGLRERPVYGWIAGSPEVEALLELPIREHPPMEARYMWASTRHWRPIVNGYSGHTPPHYERFRRICCWPVPEAEALALLRDFGVTHIVVHRRSVTTRWSQRAFARWEAAIEADEVPGVRRVYADSLGDRVYAIGGPADARPAGGDRAP